MSTAGLSRGSKRKQTHVREQAQGPSAQAQDRARQIGGPPETERKWHGQERYEPGCMERHSASTGLLEEVGVR